MMKWASTFFRWSVIIKLVLAILEVLSGVFFFVVNQHVITQFLFDVTQEELREDGTDFIATHLLQVASQFSLGSKPFIAAYLLSHGLVKLYLLYGLWKQKLFSYPLSALLFFVFLLYQVYRYQFTHATWLLILSVFDVIFIGLIVYEYKVLRESGINNQRG